MSEGPAPRDPRSRLALGCSALARAGQQLSVVSSPEQVRTALETVAAQLESDPHLSGLLPVDEIARKCRETAQCPDDGSLVSGCRMMATSLARRASSLAAEVQQRARQTAVSPAASSEPLAVPSPQSRPAGIDPGSRPSRSTATPPVSANPGVNRERFTRAGGEVIMDSRTNRMWVSAMLPGMRHAAAQVRVAQLGAGGHHDWRMPTVSELQEVLSEGGLQALRRLGVLPGGAGPRLWTSDLRSRFFGLLRSAGVVSTATGEPSRCSPSDATVQTLAVRGG